MKAPDDPRRAGRGCLVGLALGFLVWALLASVVVLARWKGWL